MPWVSQQGGYPHSQPQPFPPPPLPGQQPPRRNNRLLWGLAAAALLLALAGCGSDDDPAAPATTQAEPVATTPALDGTQGYGDPGELTADLAERGIDCTGLRHIDTVAPATGRCAIDGEEVIVQLWSSPVERDNVVSDVITALPADYQYCYVLGRGNGAWSVDVDGDLDLCGRITDALGGERFDSLPD